MGKSDYDGAELERLWKILLVNQFHDILPGSSIHEVYENAREDYAELNRGLEKLINEKLNVLFSERDPEAFTVVNYLNVPYTGEVKIKLPEGYNGVEYADEQIPCAKLSDKTGDYISFVAEKFRRSRDAHTASQRASIRHNRVSRQKKICLKIIF